MKPTISVIIPVRNRPQLVGRAIASCLAQTRQPDEIIVADDGSTDDTVEAVEQLRRDVPMLTLIRRDSSGGAAVARNTAAAAATGSYLAFLDSDDDWEPAKLAEQEVAALTYPDAPGIFCGILYRYPDRAERHHVPPPIVTREQLACGNVLASTSTGMVRRDLFEAVGGFSEDLPNCEDWDLWLKLATHGPLRVVQQTLLRYTFDADNKLSRDREKLLRGHEMVFERIMTGLDGDAPRRQISAMHELKRAEQHVRVTRSRREAWRHLAAAIGRHPTPSVVRRALHLGLLDLTLGRRR